MLVQTILSYFIWRTWLATLLVLLAAECMRGGLLIFSQAAMKK